jgi:hypothetical protein
VEAKTCRETFEYIMRNQSAPPAAVPATAATPASSNAAQNPASRLGRLPTPRALLRRQADEITTATDEQNRPCGTIRELGVQGPYISVFVTLRCGLEYGFFETKGGAGPCMARGTRFAAAPPAGPAIPAALMSVRTTDGALSVAPC